MTDVSDRAQSHDEDPVSQRSNTAKDPAQPLSIHSYPPSIRLRDIEDLIREANIDEELSKKDRTQIKSHQ